jgi:hypothetical protein
MKLIKKYNARILIVLLFIAFILFYFLYNARSIAREYFSYENIPIVVICWNNYFFVKNFVTQLKKYKNPIILLDNKSNYSKLLDYYEQIKNDDQIEIRLLDKNYGHTVYKELKSTLPDVYILSDPDLQLNERMPDNFSEILLQISNSYKSYKVGLALDISDNHKFIECDNYTNGQNIHDWESQFWKTKINHDNYEIYYADVDTTFCLVNNNYSSNGDKNVRIAGDFTVKHLPWYKDYIKTMVDPDEIEHWKLNNKSSSILFTCLKL